MAIEKLSLANICEGTLEKQFQTAYPQILQSLKLGKKATITMKIEFHRPEGTQTLAGIRSSFDVKMPPNEPQKEVYAFNADDFSIKADVQPAPEGEQNVLPFAVNK